MCEEHPLIAERPQKKVQGEDGWRCDKQDRTIYHLETVLKTESSVIMFMEQKATVDQICCQASLTLVHLRSCFHLETQVWLISVFYTGTS